MAIADIVILALIAIYGVFGFFKGFLRSLIGFCGFLISVALAVLIAKFGTKTLLTFDFAGDFVGNTLFTLFRDRMSDGLIETKVEYLRIVYAAEGADGIHEIFKAEGGFFAKIIYPIIKDGLANPTYLQSNMPNLADIAALEISYKVFSFMVGVASFIVIRIILALISLAFKSKLGEKKKFAGRFLGLLFGLLKGAVNSLILLCVVSLMTNFAFMDKPNEELEKSKIASAIMGVSVKVNTFVTKSDPDDERFKELLKDAGFDPGAFPLETAGATE